MNETINFSLDVFRKNITQIDINSIPPIRLPIFLIIIIFIVVMILTEIILKLYEKNNGEKNNKTE